jgi:hypothetical protein
MWTLALVSASVDAHSRFIAKFQNSVVLRLKNHIRVYININQRGKNIDMVLMIHLFLFFSCSVLLVGDSVSSSSEGENE